MIHGRAVQSRVMAISGLFSAVSDILKHAHREKRLNLIQTWEVASGLILEYRSIECGFHEIRPVIRYAYAVHREPYSGSATETAIRDGIIEMKGAVHAMVREKMPLQVRYDPSDPSRSYLLNPDNPHFPFDVDDDLSLT